MTDQTESDHCKHGTPRDPNWVCVQCGNEALRQSADADYDVIGATVTQTESASEHAELLADLEFYTQNDYRNPMQTMPRTQGVIDNAIAAIRALEAQVADGVRALQSMAGRWQVTIADRERLAGEVERLRVQFDEAIARIEDMLEDDDGQAFKEAGKFLMRIKGHDHES